MNNKIIFPIVLLLLAWWVSSANFVAKVEDPSQVKVLDDFESAGSAALWQGTYELSRQVATQGGQSLKVTLLSGVQKGLSTEKLPKDWSGYDWLGMEIVSKEKEPKILSLRIYDELADDERANVWSEAFLATRKVFLNPGMNHIRVLVKGMRTSSDTRAMAMDKVRRVILSNDQSGASLTIFVDNLRLVKGDPQQDRSSVSKPEDTVVSMRRC